MHRKREMRDILTVSLLKHTFHKQSKETKELISKPIKFKPFYDWDVVYLTVILSVLAAISH